MYNYNNKDIMKSIIVISAILIGKSIQNVDLGPAYRVQMSGSTNWNLIKKYDKDPCFVEGFEILNDNKLIQSVG